MSYSLHVTMGQSRHGQYPEPMMEMRVDRPVHARYIMGKLHELAAKVEVRSLEEKWVVKIEGRCIALELATGTDVEAERGMILLQELAQLG